MRYCDALCIDMFKTPTFQSKKGTKFMSEQEIILMQEAGVKAYDSDSPPSIGLKAGAFADVGTLILTNRRLVYVNKGGSQGSSLGIGRRTCGAGS